MWDWLKKLFKRKPSLREQCVAAYGEEFGKMYDMLNEGKPIGNFVETCVFIEMLQAVREGHPLKNPEVHITDPVNV